MNLLRKSILAIALLGLVACGGEGSMPVIVVPSSANVSVSSDAVSSLESSEESSIASSSLMSSEQSESSSLPASSSLAVASSIASSIVHSSSVQSSFMVWVSSSVMSIASSPMPSSSSFGVSSSLLASSSLMASSSSVTHSSVASSSAFSSYGASSSVFSSYEASSSVVSSYGVSSSESSSSIAAAPCHELDSDCDGVLDSLDSYFNCRGDGTGDGESSPYRQILAADGSITPDSTGDGVTTNAGNVLSPGDDAYAVLAAGANGGAAGVSITLNAPLAGNSDVPGKVVFVLTDNSGISSENLLLSMAFEFDSIATSDASVLLTGTFIDKTDNIGRLLTVVQVTKPATQFQSFSFLQSRLMTAAPAPRLHKVCVEDQQ